MHLFGVIVPEGYSPSGREEMYEDRENMVGRAGTWMVRLRLHSGNREKKTRGELSYKTLTPIVNKALKAYRLHNFPRQCYQTGVKDQAQTKTLG